MSMRRPLAVFVAASVVAGCGGGPDADALKKPRLAGAEIKVWMENGAPAAEALRLRIPDWEARTGAKAAIVESATPDPTADLALTSGAGIAKIANLQPLSQAFLDDLDVLYVQFPFYWRAAFGAIARKPVALPLASDRLMLWYRSDLFDDSKLKEAFRKETGSPLAPPATWADYLRVARFFQKSGATKFGCVEATDDSADGLRSFLCRAATYADDQRGYLLSSDDAVPRFDRPEFKRALEEWLAARSTSPAATGAPPDAAMARRIFLRGEAPMLLATTPPTADPTLRKDGVNPSAMSERIGVANPPWSTEYFDARTGVLRTDAKRKSLPHFATTGQFLCLQATDEKVKVAEDLLRFLGDRQEYDYLVQGARVGMLPVKPELLNESTRFASYGLPTSVVGRYFELAKEKNLASEWVADLRIAEADAIHAAVARGLKAAASGKASSAAALEQIQKDCVEIVKRGGPGLVDRYRYSLGYTALAK